MRRSQSSKIRMSGKYSNPSKGALRAVKDLEVNQISCVSDLVSQLSRAGGFVGYYLGKAAAILKRMIEEEDCIKWLSFPAAIISTGIRGVIRHALEKGYFNYVVTTCGTLDHDIARSVKEYYCGDFYVDDSKLSRLNTHRLGSVFIPSENYGEAIEKFMQDFLEHIYSQGYKELGSYELVNLLGEYIDNEDSLLKTTYKKNVLMFIPGIVDGAVGTQLWIFHQRHRDFKLNLFRDLDKLAEITFKSNRSGALILGGGISKHFLLWWSQFSGGLDFAVQITTAQEYDGSLSGSRLSEAITWGMLKQDAEHVNIYADATLVLPLLISSIEK